MKILRVLAISFALVPLHADEQTSLKYTYLKAYLELKDAKRLREAKDNVGAIAEIRFALHTLTFISRHDANWEASLLLDRIKDARKEAEDLKPLARRQVKKELEHAGSIDTLLSSILKQGRVQERAGKYFSALTLERYLATAEAADYSSSAPSFKKVQADLDRIYAAEDKRLQAASG